MSWGYKKSPPVAFSISGGLCILFSFLFRCGIGYDINTDAVGVYNGKKAVAPRLFAKRYGNR